MIPEDENIIESEQPAAPPAEEQEAAAPSSEEAPAAKQADPSDRSDQTDKRRKKPKRKEKPRRERASTPQRNKPRQPARMFDRIVVVSWSGLREPADDMFWAEAEREGDWIMIRSLEHVRTRKEILDRLTELDSGLVALNFSFSYPQEFYEFLKSSEGIGDWRTLLQRVREDLKKNVDDGVRRWIERIGKYRESKLDPNPQDDFRNSRQRSPLPRGMQRGREPLPPYEQRSIAERFRRTEHALRKAAGPHLTSPLQIGYNRLTNRYEFSDARAKGRASLLGMSMLEQLLEAKPNVAVWPWSKSGALTVVEVLPWVFTSGKNWKPQDLRDMFSAHEDSGWDIPDEVRELAIKNPEAMNTVLTLMGIIKTEARQERQRRPMRDYLKEFYADPQIQLEGWLYSVGYRLDRDHKEQQEEPSHEEKQHEPQREEPSSSTVEENVIVEEPTANHVHESKEPESEPIEIAEEPTENS
jgi:hypothetical protein